MLAQTAQSRIQTVYSPGSFTPLVRIETTNSAREKARHRSLVEVLQQEGSEDGQGVVFPAELVRMLDRLEDEIRQNAVSEASRAWLSGCGLTVEQMAAQMEEAPEPQRKIHLYHCDHRGLPLALVDADNKVAWSAGYDEWGNMLREENPQGLEQLIRLPGQQYDEEIGLYYNLYRWHDPLQGAVYHSGSDWFGGGWNLYQYPLNPMLGIDPLGLNLLLARALLPPAPRSQQAKNIEEAAKALSREIDRWNRGGSILS
ncbi:RHS domain-containing protein [Hafnia alvei]|uniref:RHS repeat-associated core domain protein n=1 Tax=Hafnia alvei ATCC 51873 TaxID=1002364 RepID=G9YD43_HAFAL|nr:RHS domain-containing protein [Hafnia alvei]EHM38085.1 RHS repeat-associated core domain protein [Hafnia alvei ATCC 51873]